MDRRHERGCGSAKAPPSRCRPQARSCLGAGDRPGADARPSDRGRCDDLRSQATGAGGAYLWHHPGSAGEGYWSIYGADQYARMFLAVIAAEPSTVVALVANGEAPEPLPHTLPAQIRCFDRWGNPTDTPTQSLRGITYLVATGDAQTPLREALKTAPESKAYGAGVEGLLQAMLRAFNQGTPPLWSLFSSLGSLAVLTNGDAAVSATRTTLRNDTALAKRFRLPGATLSA